MDTPTSTASPSSSPTSLLNPRQQQEADEEYYTNKENNQFIQSLRFKTFLVLLLLFLVLSFAFLAVILGVFPYSFLQVEALEARDSVARPLRAVFSEFDTLSKLIVNNAAWDDTYQEVLTEPKTFLPKVFGYEMCKQYNMSFGAIFSSNGTLLDSFGYNFTSDDRNLPLPVEMLALSQAYIRRISSNVTVATTGYINYHGQLHILGAGAIVKTDYTGPVAGFLMLTSTQSEYIVQKYADRAQVCLNFGIISGEGASKHFVDNYGYLVNKIERTIPSAKNSYWTVDYSDNNPVQMMDKDYLVGRKCWGGLNQTAPGKKVDGDRMMSFAIINDWNNKPSLLFIADVDRNTFQLGMTAMGIALGVLSATLIVIALVVMVFVELAVLKPIVNLTRSVEQITFSGNIAQRVGGGKESKDELGTMTQCINLMLESLDSAQEQIKNVLEKTGLQEQRARAIMNAIPDFVLCVLQDGLINHANDAFLSRLEDLESMSKTGACKETHFINPSKASDVVPITISSSQITIFINDEPVKAYAVIAKNNSDKAMLQAQIESEQNRIEEHKRKVEFNRLMGSKKRRATFREYCSRSSNQNNVDFLEVLEEYKSIKSLDARCEKQEEIIKNYLARDAPCRVNIQEEILENELPNIQRGFAQLDLFDVVADSVRSNMIKGSFIKFMQLPPSERSDETEEEWL
ncbi:regulator of G-protein signaling [Acrasis kona]|uniref:Regulator of G-protein signaling n=1 Tax=Acrasis kona TaxID=1008807 RepID=A0AAW2ZE00_9EUKA